MDGLVEQFVQIVAVHAREQQRARLADDFAGRETGDAREGGVDRDDLFMPVDNQDAFVAVVDDARMQATPFFGREIVGNLRKAGAQADRLALVVVLVGKGQLGAEHFTRFLAPLDLDQRAAVVEEKFMDPGIAVFVGIKEKDVLADRFFGTVAEQALGAAVPGRDVACAVHSDDRCL